MNTSPYTRPRRRTLRAPLLLAGALAAGPAPAADPGTEPAPTFDMYELRVIGNTVIPAAEIERALYEHLGPGRTLADVERARDALGELYKSRGYGTVLVDIPEQSVGDDGVVRLAVTEGRVDRLRVVGAKYSQSREVREVMQSAAPGGVPNLRQLQDELATLARVNPDRQVAPLLRAGRTPGTVDLEFQVADRLPLHGSVEVNNRSTADTAPLRVSASLSYDDLFRASDSLSVQYQTSPSEPSEVAVWAATYVARSLDSPNLWAFYAIDSKSDVAALGTLAVLGAGRVYGARFIRPLVNTAERSDSLTLGADYKDSLEDVRLPGQPAAATPITYLVWSAAFAHAARSPRFDWNFTAGLKFGLRGFGNTEQEFAFKRFRGRPNFVAWTGGGGVTYRFRDGERAAGGPALSLRTAFQYSPQPVVSNEQFALGGMDTVRGYLEAEGLQDSGATGTLELLSPAWLDSIGVPGAQLRALAFVDGGIGITEFPLGGQQSRITLGSAGAGLRWSAGRYGSAQLYWARALRTLSRTERGDSRILFSAQGVF